MRTNIHQTIKDIIAEKPTGDVITLTDFSNYASSKTVSKTLERLTKEGYIEKLFSGIFWKPSLEKNVNPILVAQAFARKNQWSIAPCGDTALSLLGLTQQDTNEWTFVTDDKNVVYEFQNFCLTFKHTSTKFLEGMSEQTRLLIQVIKAYGKECSPEPLKEYFAQFKISELENIVTESANVTKWILEKITHLVYGGEVVK